MPDFFDPLNKQKPENFKPLKDEAPVLENFQATSDRGIQSKGHRLIKGHHPVKREIGERELVFSQVGSVLQLNTKIDGVVKSLVFP